MSTPCKNAGHAPGTRANRAILAAMRATHVRATAVTSIGVAAAIVAACGLDLVGRGSDDASQPEQDSFVSSDAPDGASAIDVAEADTNLDAASSAETSASDALVGVDACAPDCNGGCGPLGDTCNIVVTTPRNGITCPPGSDCRIECNASGQICSGTILCPSGHTCTVVCKGTGQSCNTPSIQKNGATSLCIECSGTAGSQSCNSPSCSTSACTTYCNPQSACNGTCGCLTVVNDTGGCP